MMMLMEILSNKNTRYNMSQLSAVWMVLPHDWWVVIGHWSKSLELYWVET